MATILLFRHGETHWNRAKRIQGHTDSASPLTLKGIDQAKAYGRALRRLTGEDDGGWRIVSSPLARCVQTSGILCECAGIDFARVTLDDRLKEIGTGLFSGLLKCELEDSHPELMTGIGLNTWFFRCPGGETWDDLALRIANWLDTLKPGERVVVVTHGVAGKVLRSLYAGLTPEAVLAEDSPQDALFILRPGSAVRMGCAEAATVIGSEPRTQGDQR